MMERLMAWLFPKTPEQAKLEERLRHAETVEIDALNNHRTTAIQSTIRADDAREAIEALLADMERRRKVREDRNGE